MSTPTFETANTQGHSPEERHLPSAISRRIIFHLVPNEDSLMPLTPEGACTFNRILHEGEHSHDSSRVVTRDGEYWIDFPNQGPTSAAEQLSKILLEHTCEDFADAQLQEARIERLPDALTGVTIAEAWDQMDDVTKLVNKIMDWKQQQLLNNSMDHMRFDAA